MLTFDLEVLLALGMLELDVFAFLGGDGVDPLLFLAVVLLDVTVPFEELKKSAGTRSLTKPKTTLKLAVRS